MGLFQGPASVPGEKVLFFSQGLYGLEHLTRFAILELAEPPLPIKGLQSLEDEAIALVVAPTSLFWPDYRPPIDEEVLAGLGADSAEELLLLAILTLAEEEPPTANLRAPLLVHPARRRGRQVILQDDAFPLRQPLPLGSLEGAGAPSGGGSTGKPAGDGEEAGRC